MKKPLSLILILFVANLYSQEVVVKEDSVQLPISIYTISIDKLLSINNQLQIDEKEDVILNAESIKKEISTIFTERLGRKSIKFFNEEFQRKALNKVITSTFFDIDALYNLPRENPKITNQ